MFSIFCLFVVLGFLRPATCQTLAMNVAAKAQWDAVPDTNAASNSTRSRSAQDILTSQDNDTNSNYQGFKFDYGPNFLVKLTLSNGQSVDTGSAVDVLDLQSQPVGVLYPFEMTSNKFYHVFMVDLDTWAYDATNGYTIRAYWITPNLSPYSAITSCTPGTYNVKYVAPDFAPWSPGQIHRIAVLVLSSTSELTAAPTTADAKPSGFDLTVYDKDGNPAAAVSMRDGQSFSNNVDAGIFIKVLKPTDVVSQLKQAKVWETTKWKTKGPQSNGKPSIPYGFKSAQSLRYGKSAATSEATQTGTPVDVSTEDFTKAEFTYGNSAQPGTLYTIALTMLDDDTASNVEVLNLLVVNTDGSELQSNFSMDAVTAVGGNNLAAYTAPAAATAMTYYRCVLWIMRQAGSLNVDDPKVKPTATTGFSIAAYAKDNNLSVDGAFLVYLFKPE